jgi:hypothetical protein
MQAILRSQHIFLGLLLPEVTSLVWGIVAQRRSVMDGSTTSGNQLVQLLLKQLAWCGGMTDISCKCGVTDCCALSLRVTITPTMVLCSQLAFGTCLPNL